MRGVTPYFLPGAVKDKLLDEWAHASVVWEQKHLSG